MTGRVIAGRYLLEQPIGRGAMGMVWRAHDQLLDREVAVKEVVLSASIGVDERHNAYQRTLREARTAARLSHRGVVTVYDVAEEDGRPWIVMELVPSRSLDQVLAAEGPMTPLRAGRVGQQLLAALAAAHAAGVLHRDVKPSNVLIAVDRSAGGWDERAVLTDFGIAQFEGDPRLTQTGMVMGSPGFTAPERIRGGDATPASDLWSLGATIYAAVEGRGPYEQRGGAITTMSAIINEDAPVAPSGARLAPLIAALLRREPSARPPAAAAARMFTEVLPLLSDGPAHPATLRSAYVPPPAAHAASAGASTPPAAAELGAVGAQAAAAGPGAADCPEPEDAPAASAVEAAEAPAPAVAHAGDALPAGGQSADALAGVAAAGAGAVAEEMKAADEAPHGAAPAEVAASAAVATSLDSAPEDSGPSRSDVTWVDSGAGGSENALADTVIPARKPEGLAADPGVTVAGPGKTERSLPAPKSSSAAPQPKPTFTASNHTEQAAPSFSPSRPAPPVPPQPASPYSSSRSAWRADPPTMPEPAYEAPQYGGSNPQYGSHQGSHAQYSGPAQPHPDLARQYAPGTGGRAQRGSRRGRMIALIIAALVAAAAIGGGAAYLMRHHTNTGSSAANTSNNVSLKNQPGSIQALDTPSSAVPTGWTSMTVQPTGAAAGFSIDIPPGWSVQRSGLVTYFTAPDGVHFMDIDLTPHTNTNMVTEAYAIESHDIVVGKFPDYKRAALKAAPVRSTNGAFWQFTWNRNGIDTRTDDILFILPTSAGSQSYAIYFRAPDSGWNGTNLPLFEKMLHTFQTVPA